jgi:hypothetical protein
MDSNENVPKYPAKPYNKPLPKSQTSSGGELDEVCEADYQQSVKPNKEA